MMASADQKAQAGVVVADGYGVAIRVIRGRLEIEDGVGLERRTRRFHRATSRLRRLVVLGSSGVITLEALRWLSDLGAAFVQIGRDGHVIASYGPAGTDRPSLRRAQAVAHVTGRALELSRWLVTRKLTGQAETLRSFAGLVQVDGAMAVVEAYGLAIPVARTIDDLRSSEAFAAGAYWQALAPLQVRFARRDADGVPTHWRTFGGRSSPLGNGPRLAANPANAMLNYLYALLEAEATLATRIVGLDPGMGVMHADQAHRDSLAADLMEPVRPAVDAYALELLTRRSFAARDFHERRSGQCMLTAPLTHELARTIPRWRQLVGRIAEDFAAALDGAEPSPTPITGRRRAASRPSGPRPTRRVGRHVSSACSWCGIQIAGGGRRTCRDECAARVLGQVHENFARASSDRMKRLAASPNHPALTEAANQRRRTTRAEQMAAQRTWEQDHPEPIDGDSFTAETVGNLAPVSARAISRATGLSVSYCAAIKRGERVPHPRWWATLRHLTTS